MANPTETTISIPPTKGRFSNLIGHEPVVEYLRQACEHKRLPQTLLFDGPSGIGKSAMAYALAKYLLAGGVEDGPQYEHHARKVEAEQSCHPDLHLLTPSGAAGQIKIDSIRSAMDMACQMPMEGARRVMIIDPADRLNITSANSLLKILEEPPPLLTMILATESLHCILPTIRSRAARLRLHPVANETLADWLVQRFKAEPKIARLAALFSNGSPGKAITQLSGKTLADRDALIGEWQFFQQNGFQCLFRVACNLAEIAQPLENVLAAWMTWLRDALVACTSPGRADLLVNADRADDLEKEAQRLGPRVIGRCLERLVEAAADTRRMINRQLFFETLLLRLGPELKRA